MRLNLSRSTRSATWLVLSLPILCLTPRAAHAVPVTATSTASGEQVSLTLTPIVGTVATISSGPLPVATGSGSTGYSFANSALSASLGGLLSTGILDVGADATFAGSGAAVSAVATVNGVDIGILKGLLNVLGLSTAIVQSNAGLTAGGGSISARGGTTIEGLSVAGLAPFGAMIIPGVNDVILNLLGITITLNKETLTGSAGGPRSLAVNGIDVSFNNVAATLNGKTGLLNGTIDIANSYAFLSGIPTSVPEPASLAMLAGGLCAMSGLKLTRKRAAVRH